MTIDVSFPWAKIEIAKRWLYAVKPWWARYGERFTIYPFSVPPPQGSNFGGLCFSTHDWKIFIDSSMANAVPVEVLAASIERELHRAVRNVPKRMSGVGKKEYSLYGHIAAELEICSVMREENLGFENVFNDYFVNLEFSDILRNRWGIVSIPTLPDDFAIYPEFFGFPDKLRMEEYFRLLAFPEDDDKDEEDSEDSDSSEFPTNSDNLDDSDSEEEGEDFSDGDSPHNDDDSDEDVSSDFDSGFDGEEQPGDDDGDSGEEQLGGSGVGIDASSDDEQLDSDPNSTGSGVGVNSDDEQLDSEPNSAGGASNDKEQSDNESDSADSGEEQLDNSVVKGIEDKVEELLESPEKRWYTRDYVEPEGIPEPDDIFSNSSDREALEELSEDMLKSRSSSSGRKPGNMAFNVVDEILGTGNSWESAWQNALSLKIGEYKVFGGQDLSYSVRNPNQPNSGPILMGMYDTTPSIAVIMDNSGSMYSFVKKALNAFADIVFSSISGSGMPVTWLSVDMGINGVGEVSSVSEIDSIKTEITKGYGGTDIGPIIEDLTSGSVVWEGSNVDVPDIVIVCTDCIFEWPWPDEISPNCDSLILVASVESYAATKSNLPRWVVDGENFFFLDL